MSERKTASTGSSIRMSFRLVLVTAMFITVPLAFTCLLPGIEGFVPVYLAADASAASLAGSQRAAQAFEAEALELGDPWSDIDERAVSGSGGYGATLTTALYSFGDPSAAEQAHLEAINRARMNPQAEAARLGIDLFEGVDPGDISGEPVQPITFNAILIQVAREHSQDMISQQYFAHNSPDGRSPFDRMRDAGYEYRTAGENIAWRGSTAPLDEVNTVLVLHDNLFIDEGIPGRGHRVNILYEDFKEVGLGVASGAFGQMTYAYMLTCDFGASLEDTDSFLLGVVYDDQNGDGLYTAGEGMANVDIRVVPSGDGTSTASAGGYGLSLSPGSYTVEATLADGRSAGRQITINDENVKVDFLLSDFGDVEITGNLVTPDLWIAAMINTEELGSIEAVWQLGGDADTSRGDRVIWGYFYASPDDVSWGSRNNPDLYVKIWFDAGGRLDVNFFHVSVPDIVVYSDYTYDGNVDEQSTTTLSTRYIRQFYENGQSDSDEQTEDGNPPGGFSPSGNPTSYGTMNSLNIGAMINTEELGLIDAIWQLGGTDSTAAGDQVVWGHFYASPDDVTWGSSANPDLFVKVWFDNSGRIDVNFFHVSVPDIEVYSDYPGDGTYDQAGTTIMSNRYIRQEYQR